MGNNEHEGRARRREGGKRKSAQELPERYRELNLDTATPEELLRLRRELSDTGDWRYRGGKKLLDQIDWRLQRTPQIPAEAGMGRQETTTQETTTPPPQEEKELIPETAGEEAVKEEPERREEAGVPPVLEVPEKRMEEQDAVPSEVAPASREESRKDVLQRTIERLQAEMRAAEDKIAGIEDEERRTEIARLKAEIDEISNAVQHHRVMEQYGSQFHHDRSQTFEYVEALLREKEQRIRELETPSMAVERPTPETAVPEERTQGEEGVERTEVSGAHPPTLEPLVTPEAAARPERVEPPAEETETERQSRLIRQALKKPSLRERWSLDHERRTLQRLRKILETGGALSETEEGELWGAMSNIYYERIKRSPSPDLGEALLESYEEFVKRDGYLGSPEVDADILDRVSRTVSLEDALRVYETFRQLHPDVGHVEGEGPAEPLPLAIGRVWLESVRASVSAAERSKDRASVVDTEHLGRLKAIIEASPTAETIPNQLRAAQEYVALLEGKPAPEREREEPVRRVPQSLEERRSHYARAVQSQSRLVGRASAEELERLRTDYQAAIETQIAAKVSEIAHEAPGRSFEAEIRVQEAFVDLVLRSRQEEESALRESMRTNAERTAADRFKRFWRQHPKARIAISLALTGATVGSAATGNVLAAGIFQSAKSLLAGTSSAFAAEAIWERSREAFGGTRKLTQEHVAKLSDTEIERRVAAHTVSGARMSKKHYEEKLGRGETIRLLLSEQRKRSRERLASEIEKLRAAGLTPEQITEAVLLHSMAEEQGLHHAYESRAKEDRTMAVRKWSVSIGTGIIVGALTGGLGAMRIARMAEAATVKEASEHAVERGAAVADSVQTETVERVPIIHEQAADSTESVVESPQDSLDTQASEIPPSAASDGETAKASLADTVKTESETGAAAEQPDTTATRPADLHDEAPPAPGSPTADVHEHPAPRADVEWTESGKQILEKLGTEPLLELSEKSQEAYQELSQTFQLLDDLDPATVSELKGGIYALPARDAFDRDVVEVFIDRQEGGTHEFAERYAKILERLFKSLPKGHIRQSDTIGHIITRITTSLDASREATG